METKMKFYFSYKDLKPAKQADILNQVIEELLGKPLDELDSDDKTDRITFKKASEKAGDIIKEGLEITGSLEFEEVDPDNFEPSL